jgi:VCBS repeat-containing protein
MKMGTKTLFVLMVLLLAAFTTGRAHANYEEEPNDTRYSANSFALGSPLQGDFDMDSSTGWREDYWQFTAESGKTYHFTGSISGGFLNDAILGLSIENGSGSILADDYANSSSSSVSLDWTASANGTFYLVIYSANLESTNGIGDYTVNTSVTGGGTPPPDPTPDPEMPANIHMTTLNLKAKDLIYDPQTQLIYASVPGAAGVLGNTLTPIDPVTGQVKPAVYVGSEPGKLAISPEGRVIYISVTGSAQVARFDTYTQSVTKTFSLGNDDWSGPIMAYDMTVMPGAPNTVAIVRRYVDSYGAGMAIYDDGVARTTMLPNEDVDSLEFSDSASTLYGYDQAANGSASFHILGANASGISLTSTHNNLITSSQAEIKFYQGKVYSTSGQVINISGTPAVAGTYSQSGEIAPKTDVNRTVVLKGNILYLYNKDTFALLGTYTMPGISTSTGSLISWGQNGLAFRSTSTDKVYVMTMDELMPTNPTPLPTPVEIPVVSPPAGLNVDPTVVSAQAFSLDANDLTYDAPRNRLLASLNGFDYSHPNSVVAVNPSTGQVTSTLLSGNSPGVMAVSQDGQYLYVAKNTPESIAQITLSTGATVRDISIGDTITDIDVMPGQPETIAVAVNGNSSGDVMIYDAGVKRAGSTANYFGSSIAFNDDGTEIYQYNNATTGFDLYRLVVGASSLTKDYGVGSLFTGFALIFSRRRAYSTK